MKLTLVSQQTGRCSELRGGRFWRYASISNVWKSLGGIQGVRCLEDVRFLEGPLSEVPMYIILYSRSVDPQKLCVGVKYYIVLMYNIPYYTYGSIANFLFLEPTVLIYIYIEKTAL